MDDTAPSNKPQTHEISLSPHTQHAGMELKRSGGGAKARSTPRKKGLGRGWAIPPRSRGAEQLQMMRRPQNANSRKNSLATTRSTLKRSRNGAAAAPRRAPHLGRRGQAARGLASWVNPLPAIQPAAAAHEYAFQPAWGSSCGLPRGSAFGAPSACGHEPMGRSSPGPFPCSGSRPAAAART